MITWLSPDLPPDRFPPVEQAMTEPAGLLAVGGDLRPERLLAAYRQGIFPWYSQGQPILWWSPDPREVLRPAEFHCSRSLRRVLDRNDYQIRHDSDFAAVIDACAAPRAASPGTWILAEMRNAYCRLHSLGFAHCLEVWRDEQLIGGIYGVRLGKIFFGESMFSRADNGSKIALAHLVRFCVQQQIQLIDCQLPSAHLRSLGSRAIPRSEFVGLLSRYCEP